MSKEGETSKRSLEDDVADDEPPKKKQRLSQKEKKKEGEKNVNGDASNDQSESKVKENENVEARGDVRTITGYDRPTHFEIWATDPEKMIDFYTKVFKWKFSPMHMGDTKYWGIQTGPFEFGKNPKEALSTYGVAGGLAVREGKSNSNTRVTPHIVHLLIIFLFCLGFCSFYC